MSPSREKNPQPTGRDEVAEAVADARKNDAWGLSTWLRQSPSWLTSMVVHMMLLLLLGLWAIPQDMKDNFTEIVLGEPDTSEEDTLEEAETNASLEIPPVEIEGESEQKIDEMTSMLQTQVERPDAGMSMPDSVNDVQPEAVLIGSPGAINVIVSDGEFGSQDMDGEHDFGWRQAEKERIAKKNPEIDEAVEAALRWLANHQNSNGSWSWEHTPGGRCSGFANPGNKKSTMGATGMALLPFLGAGYTHQEGPYQDTVGRGVEYLLANIKIENNAGRLFLLKESNREHMYCHGIAACALAEAYGMTQDSRLWAPAQMSLNYIVQAQHVENGGWAYLPRQGGDTSVVGWQIMALKSGILSGLHVPGHVKAKANQWLDFVQATVPPDGYGIGSNYGYRSPAANRPGTTAIGLLCRNYLGTPKDDPGLRLGVEWIAKKGPDVSPDSRADMYYNYYASQVMFQNDGPKGPLWQAWDATMKDYLVRTQVKNGSDQGSWYHHSGHYSQAGGRLYDTALSAMTLEVYYRYMPVYQPKNVARDDFPIE